MISEKPIRVRVVRYGGYRVLWCAQRPVEENTNVYVTATRQHSALPHFAQFEWHHAKEQLDNVLVKEGNRQSARVII